MACGNRLPISGECLIGCGGYGSCRQGDEKRIHPRDHDRINYLTVSVRNRTSQTSDEVHRVASSLRALPDGGVE